MQGRLLSAREAVQVARSAERVGVLGIAPETKADRPAHYVPAALHSLGVKITPVPVYYPEVKHILGEPVLRRLADVPGPALDILDVFRKPTDLAPHLPDLLAMPHKPKVVWLQSGITDQAFEREVMGAGMDVVADRCLMVDRGSARARI